MRLDWALWPESLPDLFSFHLRFRWVDPLLTHVATHPAKKCFPTIYTVSLSFAYARGMGSSATIQPDGQRDQQVADSEKFVSLNGVLGREDLLDAKKVAHWLDVTEDWVWDHTTRRAPFLPAI